MSDLPSKDPGEQLDWLAKFVNEHIADLKTDQVAGIVLKLADTRIRLIRLQNGQTDDSDFEALQRELGG